jgi:PleD family two-component response regulator
VSAGITELVSADDRASLLERAERAVSQARQAGDGTVVVATANGSH